MSEKIKVMKYVKTIDVEKEYVNNSGLYQLVGDYDDVIMSGTEEECVEKLDTINVENSKWSVVSVETPGERKTIKFKRPIYEDEYRDKKEFEDELFNLLTGGKNDKN